MKKFIFLMMIAFLALSCRTPQQLVDKALKKDAAILNKYTTKYDTIVRFDTILKVPDTVIIKETKTQLFPFNPDKELFNVYQTLYDSQKVRLDYIIDSLGNENMQITAKGDTIYREIEVPYVVEVNVPGKQGPTIVKVKKDIFWYLGILTIIAIILYVLLLVRRKWREKKIKIENSN